MLQAFRVAVAAGRGQAHLTRDLDRQQFAEVVIDAVVAPTQRDLLDLVARIDCLADRHAADGAGAVLSVQPAGRLRLRQRVGAGVRSHKLVPAAPSVRAVATVWPSGPSKRTSTSGNTSSVASRRPLLFRS